MLEAAQIADQVLQLSQPDVAAAVSALPVLADLQAGATAIAAASDVQSAVSTYTYTPGPIEVGWQIWFAAFVSTVPFVIGAYEFGKRIVSFLCVQHHESLPSMAHTLQSGRWFGASGSLQRYLASTCGILG